jgi:hypothetical protein
MDPEALSTVSTAIFREKAELLREENGLSSGMQNQHMAPETAKLGSST